MFGHFHPAATLSNITSILAFDFSSFFNVVYAKTVNIPSLVAQVSPTKTSKKDTATPDATKEQVT